MMRYELWAAILAASADIDRLVARTTGDLPDRRPLSPGPARTTTPHLETAWRDIRPEARAEASNASVPPRVLPSDERDHERLAGLREAVRARLEALWRAIEGQPGVDEVRRALVIYFDERIMRLLPEYLRLSWPLLQTELTRSATGGADFFRFVGDALDDHRTPSWVLEVQYFCLSHGFLGMLATDTARLDDYRGRLSARIATPTAKPPADLVDLGELREPWPGWVYYVLGVLGVVAIAVLLIALSNYSEPPRPYDPSSASSHRRPPPLGARRRRSRANHSPVSCGGDIVADSRGRRRDHDRDGGVSGAHVRDRAIVPGRQPAAPGPGLRCRRSAKVRGGGRRGGGGRRSDARRARGSARVPAPELGLAGPREVT